MAHTLAILVLLLSASSVSAQAEASDEVKAHAEQRRLNSPWLFLGVNGGYINSNANPPEQDKDGFIFSGKILGSIYSPRWVFDLGAGYFTSTIRGPEGLPLRTTVRTNAGFAEFSPRYRMGRHWQIGPVINVLFGTEVTFNESTQENGSVSVLGGGRIQYEFPISNGNMLVRVGGQLLTDIGISQRSMLLAQADFQVGFPLSRMQERSESSAVRTAPVADIITVVLDERIILFETGRAKIVPEYREKLGRFVELMASNLDEWRDMEIAGHTDARGGRKFNIKLSYDRAMTVSQALTDGGVPSARIEVRGHGPDNPVDSANNAEAWRKNRRVEIRIVGVKNPDRLSSEINEIWPEL